MTPMRNLFGVHVALIRSLWIHIALHLAVVCCCATHSTANASSRGPSGANRRSSIPAPSRGRHGALSISVERGVHLASTVRSSHPPTALLLVWCPKEALSGSAGALSPARYATQRPTDTRCPFTAGAVRSNPVRPAYTAPGAFIRMSRTSWRPAAGGCWIAIDMWRGGMVCLHHLQRLTIAARSQRTRTRGCPQDKIQRTSRSVSETGAVGARRRTV